MMNLNIKKTEKVAKEKYNIFLSGKIKTFEGTEEQGYLLSDYVNNDFPTKIRRLVVNDRIRPSRFQLIKSLDEWNKSMK